MKLICLQSSILSQGTLGCQEFLIYLGVDTITLSVSDTPLPHVKKRKRSGERKRDTHSSSNSDLLAHMLEGDDLLQFLPLHKLKPTDTLHSTASVCCRDSVATFSSLTDPSMLDHV